MKNPIIRKERGQLQVKVRNISPKYIEEIFQRCAELSTKTGQKWTQNDYLKCLIERDFHRPLVNYKKDQFDQAIDCFGVIIEQNTQALEKYTETTNKLISILIDHEGGEDH
ncbi:hypothetical protein ACSFCM_17805 [Enterococcus gilvus]